MKRALILTSTLFCALASNVSAQNINWQSVSGDDQCWINVMYEDTISDLLYFGGGAANGTGMMVYDGNTMDTLGNLPANMARAIIRFHDTIYVGGWGPYHLAKWNGSSWDTAGINANAPVWSLHVFNGELYVGGMFSSIGGISSYGLSKYDGTTWSDISGFPFTTLTNVNAITDYNGELYVGGSFRDSAFNIMNIARWDGAQWHDVGGGFHGGMDEVSSFEILNNELYIGGAFRASAGNVGNYIAKWDGSTLSDVGGSVAGAGNGNGQIFDLAVYNNSVYAVGCFVSAGGIYTSHIAKWDGANWCSLGDTFSIPITCVSPFNGDLYIGGSYWEIDGDTVWGLGKWTGGSYVDSCGNTTGIPTAINSQTSIKVFPNPSGTTTKFQFSDSKQRTIIVQDNLGREIWRRESSEMSVEFPVSEFSAGMYFYQVEENGAITATGKFLKQ